MAVIDIAVFLERRQVAPLGYTVQGQGTPVVFLHSSMSSKDQWRKLARTLADGHRVVAIDLYGYGDAPYPASPNEFSLANEVERVEAVLREAVGESQPLHLVGHSYGGGVALQIALKHPRRVISLALYEPTAFHVLKQDDPARAEVEWIAAASASAHREGRSTEAAAMFVDYWNEPGAFGRQSADMQALFSSKMPKVGLDFRGLLHAPMTWEDYRVLSMPACLIAGRASPASSRRVAEVLAGALPCCQLTWIAAGHMAPITHSTTVNPIIERFIADVEAYPAPWHAVGE